MPGRVNEDDGRPDDDLMSIGEGSDGPVATTAGGCDRRRDDEAFAAGRGFKAAMSSGVVSCMSGSPLFRRGRPEREQDVKFSDVGGNIWCRN